jgi:hypothetical protein
LHRYTVTSIVEISKHLLVKGEIHGFDLCLGNKTNKPTTQTNEKQIKALRK